LENDITKVRIFSAFLWKLLEKSGTQGFQFILMIVLARLLLPEDFGLVVIVTIFISTASLLVESGFGEALIQKKNPDEIDYSSVFYLNIFVASVLYGILYFAAPFIALLFEEPTIILILRVLSLVLFFGALNLIQNVILTRTMQFKKLFISSFGAIIISGVIGITMASTHFGVWALVGQQLSYQILFTIIIWLTVGWRPKIIFSMKRIRRLFSYGSKLLVSSILYTSYLNLQSFLIGKMYSAATLGYYNRGMQLPSVIISNLNGSIQTVMFPALASQQDDKQKVKNMVRKTVAISSFIVFPMLVGLAVTAESVIKILLNDHWLPAVPFLQIFCAYYAFWPIDTSNNQVIKALGRSEIFLKLEVIKTIFGLTMMVIAMQFGALAIAFGVLAFGVFSTIIGGYTNTKLINYSYKEQLKDILSPLCISLLMGVTVAGIELFQLSTLITLLLQIIVGTVVYVCASIIFKLDGFNYLLWTFNDMRRNKVVVDGA
jgi:teichuronic acid exporter